MTVTEPLTPTTEATPATRTAAALAALLIGFAGCVVIWVATPYLYYVVGVENITDRFYREHLDFRTGRGTFRPGVNFYLLTEIVY